MNKCVQQMHGRPALSALVYASIYPHMWIVIKGNQQGVAMMFIRSVWMLRRTLNIPQILSEMSFPAERTSDQLGLYHTEFFIPKSAH
jgi:hypothetical protein